MGRSNGGTDRRGRAASEDHAPRLADDRFYRTLAAGRRRRVLYYLSEEGESTVAELATVLSGWEATAAGTMRTSAERSRVRLELEHSHLPRLADEGLIEYDRRAGAVRLGSLHPQVVDLVRRSIRAERPDDS